MIYLKDYISSIIENQIILTKIINIKFRKINIQSLLTNKIKFAKVTLNINNQVVLKALIVFQKKLRINYSLIC